MTKKRVVIAYDKLNEEQRKKLSRQYPDGYAGQLTEIKKPDGETIYALIWELEEVIYLVKMTKAMSIRLDEEDEDDEDTDLIGVNEDSSEEDDLD